MVPFGVTQWFRLGTFMMEVSGSKPLTSESKGFAFWVELVAPGLASVGYLSYVACQLLHMSRGFTLSAAGSPCHKKNDGFAISALLSGNSTYFQVKQLVQYLKYILFMASTFS